MWLKNIVPVMFSCQTYLDTRSVLRLYGIATHIMTLPPPNMSPCWSQVFFMISGELGRYRLCTVSYWPKLISGNQNVSLTSCRHEMQRSTCCFILIYIILYIINSLTMIFLATKYKIAYVNWGKRVTCLII